MMQIGTKVASEEHEGAIGTVYAVAENGSLKIEWFTPASKSFVYPRVNCEVWPVSDHHLLIEV